MKYLLYSHIKCDKDRIQSKLENADIDTQMKRREAIIKEIEDTKAELQHQRMFREVISEMINELVSP